MAMATAMAMLAVVVVVVVVEWTRDATKQSLDSRLDLARPRQLRINYLPTEFPSRLPPCGASNSTSRSPLFLSVFFSCPFAGSHSAIVYFQPGRFN